MQVVVPGRDGSVHSRRPSLYKRTQPEVDMLIGAIATLLVTSLPPGLHESDAVRMDRGVLFLGAELPREVALDGTLPVDLYFAGGELEEDEWIFVHVQAEEGAENCRLVADRKPEQPGDGAIHHRVELKPTPACRPGRFEVYTGIYSRDGGERLKVVEPPSGDDRIHAAYVRFVEGAPAGGTRVLAPSDMRWQSRLRLFRPWRYWTLGVLLAALLTAVLAILRRRARASLPPRLVTTNRPRLAAANALLFVPLILSVLAALDFVKDDAYISFRYAHNLVTGHGLVFNPGERLEGYTNFLWTVLIAPFEAMGADLFQVSEVLGTALAIALLVGMTLTSIHVNGTGRWLAFLWGGFWLATQSSLGLWATSGLELPLAMALPVWGAYLLWTGQRDGDRRRALASGIIVGLGCMTRPDIHLMGIVIGLPLVVEAVRTRRVTAFTALWFAGLLGVTVPFHAFRLIYYGSLLPNTFYVKTGDSSLLMVAGLRKLNEMFSFNAIGALVILSPLAFLDRRRLTEKLVMAGIAVGYMAYIVKVGVDEMRWHRLYLPALPFLVMLAFTGLRSLVDTVASLARDRRAVLAATAAGWVLVAAGGVHNFAFTYRSMGGFNGRGELSGTYHPDMGKFLVRHERPGALVAFQDMGSTPYHAPDIDFLDFIGLTDSTVARARYSYGLNAYTATESYRNQARFDAEMREYFFDRSPEWTILTVYVRGQAMQRVARAFAADPGPDALRPYYAGNGYQFGLWRDARFHDRYVHVRTWPRSISYYLSLFRRKDLWERKPREVVLDEPPPDPGGVKASFEGGLELLGSRMEHEAVERRELYVTTWWRLPGPLPEDTFFFLHLNAPGVQVAYDHIPGDWMYPADRWEPGEILENRVLFQVPVGVEPGTYEMHLGVYSRSSGLRFGVLEGHDDGSDRLHLGTVTIEEMIPFVHHTILPTDVQEHRKHPDRIIDSRAPAP